MPDTHMPGSPKFREKKKRNTIPAQGGTYPSEEEPHK